MDNTQILTVTDDVKWIGILDRDLVTFDIVMETKYGTTYNSYFIDAAKKTIIETAKEGFTDEYLQKIKTLTNTEEIEYIVLNHTEPDHSGALKHLLKIAPNATVVGTGQAINYLSEMLDGPFASKTVKGGDTLDLGNKKLQFIGAPNLHWPDTMYTYLVEDKLLFTCDSFGAHYCTQEMFDDLVDDYDEAFKYYFDVILKPFSKFMLKAINKIKPLDIHMICPGHGPILRKNWKAIVEKSEYLSQIYINDVHSERTNVLITYVSAYGYTKEMANKIAEGIRNVADVDIEITDIEHISLGELEEKVVKSSVVLVGSPTINQNTLLPVYKLFSVINPIRDKGKLAGSFGSYGWSGEAVKLIDEHLKNLKFNVLEEGLSVKFYPYNDKASQMKEFGKKYGQKIKALQAVND